MKEPEPCRGGKYIKIYIGKYHGKLEREDERLRKKRVKVMTNVRVTHCLTLTSSRIPIYIKCPECNNQAFTRTEHRITYVTTRNCL